MTLRLHVLLIQGLFAHAYQRLTARDWAVTYTIHL